MDSNISKIDVQLDYFSFFKNLKNEETFVFKSNHIEFLSLTWEFKTDFQNNEIWLFTKHQNEIFRTKIIYQKTIKIVTGEVKRRINRGVYELCAVFKGTIGKKKEKKSHNQFLDLNKIKDKELIEAYNESKNGTSSKVLDELFQKKIKQVEEVKLQIEVDKPQVKDNGWTKLLNQWNIPEDYTSSFLFHHLEIDDIAYLTDKDLEDIFEIKGYRIKFQKERDKIIKESKMK